MTDKPEIKAIFAQVRAPRGTDPGAAVEGRYIVTDGEVILTDPKGNPVRNEYGKFYKQKMVAGDNERQIASRMTKTFRSALRGKNGGRVAGFETGPLIYPKIVTI